MPTEVFVPQQYATIQDGVNAVDTYGTVVVAAGTYNESVTITKTLQLHGAQYGVNATTRSGAAGTESIITFSTASGAVVNINADNVVIDGFTIQGNTLNPGIATSVSHSGYWIFNNIVQDNVFGIYLNSSGVFYSQVKQNLIQNNNQPGSASGNGIYSDLGTSNLFIYRNKITGHTSGSIALYGTTQSNVNIFDNTIVSDSTLAMATISNVKIAENTITNIPFEGISLQGGCSGIQIESNIIENEKTWGVIVSTVASATPNSNIRMKYNDISGNGVGGLLVVSGSYSGTLDATNDWWGSSSGPNYNGTGPGTGQAITDPSNVVVYTPFLTTNPLTPTSVVTPIQRLVSNSSSVYIATDRSSAVLEAISGVGQVAVQESQFISWPNLQKFVNDNSSFGDTENPIYVWDSTTSDGQSRGFAIASNSFTLTTTSQLLIDLTAFADNALEAQIDLVDATTNTIVSTSPLGTLLMDGSMDPVTGVTTDTSPPYIWQNVRFYSVASDLISAGAYKIVVSFQVVNYNQFPGLPNPAGLSFVADIYQAV